MVLSRTTSNRSARPSCTCWWSTTFSAAAWSWTTGPASTGSRAWSRSVSTSCAAPPSSRRRGCRPRRRTTMGTTAGAAPRRVAGSGVAPPAQRADRNLSRHPVPGGEGDARAGRLAGGFFGWAARPAAGPGDERCAAAFGCAARGDRAGDGRHPGAWSARKRAVRRRDGAGAQALVGLSAAPPPPPPPPPGGGGGRLLARVLWGPRAFAGHSTAVAIDRQRAAALYE